MGEKLTREELAEFLPNHKAIKIFEDLLFEASTGSEVDVSVQEVSIDASNAGAKANQAISGNVKNEIRSKSNGVLIWLSM